MKKHFTGQRYSFFVRAGEEERMAEYRKIVGKNKFSQYVCNLIYEDMAKKGY